MKVLVAGGTGLVGSCVVRRLVDRRDEVVALGRRPTGVATEDQIVDFDALPSLPHADAAFCGLGTTIKAAGSQHAFRAIDVDAVIAFAERSQEAGVKHFVLVTAVGADADSAVFYSRMKGEVERTVEAMDFGGVDILQPGLLIGQRSERRPVEGFFQAISPIFSPLLPPQMDRYGGIGADAVARAVVTILDRGPAQVLRHENRSIRLLAER